MLKINTRYLSILKHRFDEQISESDILAWLYNFEEEDWESALILLNNICYYSEKRCCAILEYGLSTILKECSDLPIFFLPIGGIGKSGGVMAYYIKKIMGKPKVQYSFVADINFKYNNIPCAVVLLDDFIGSGNSAITLYQRISVNIPQNSKCFCLCVAYMEKAENKLTENGITILGEKHLPAFTSRHSVFGYPPKMKRIRNFALKYGELLYKKKQYSPGMKLYIGPLGYANSQSLVCFEHTTPNNTLPILWESKKRADNQENWVPLFPRKLFDRIKNDSFERMKYQWASISQKLNYGTIHRLFNDYKKNTLHLLGLLHCLYYNRSLAYTCVLLEITAEELNQLKQNAIEKGLLTEIGLLSEEGKTIYERIKKEEFKVDSLVYYQINVQNDVYLPQEFLGLSRN